MHTRVWANKLCPTPGESFYTNHRRPILQVIEDTCGVHDLMTAPCDEHRYRLYGVEGDHPSCAGNLKAVMADHFGGRPVYVPQPFDMLSLGRVSAVLRPGAGVPTSAAPSDAGFSSLSR